MDDFDGLPALGSDSEAENEVAEVAQVAEI